MPSILRIPAHASVLALILGLSVGNMAQAEPASRRPQDAAAVEKRRGAAPPEIQIQFKPLAFKRDGKDLREQMREIGATQSGEESKVPGSAEFMKRIPSASNDELARLMKARLSEVLLEAGLSSSTSFPALMMTMWFEVGAEVELRAATAPHGMFSQASRATLPDQPRLVVTGMLWAEKQPVAGFAFDGYNISAPESKEGLASLIDMAAAQILADLARAKVVDARSALRQIVELRLAPGYAFLSSPVSAGRLYQPGNLWEVVASMDLDPAETLLLLQSLGG